MSDTLLPDSLIVLKWGDQRSCIFLLSLRLNRLMMDNVGHHSWIAHKYRRLLFQWMLLISKLHVTRCGWLRKTTNPLSRWKFKVMKIELWLQKSTQLVDKRSFVALREEAKEKKTQRWARNRKRNFGSQITRFQALKKRWRRGFPVFKNSIIFRFTVQLGSLHPTAV